MDRETAVRMWREIGLGMPGGGATGRLIEAFAIAVGAAEREQMIADGWRQTRYVAPVTDCEACLTPDACAIRGQCGHYLRERA